FRQPPNALLEKHTSTRSSANSNAARSTATHPGNIRIHRNASASNQWDGTSNPHAPHLHPAHTVITRTINTKPIANAEPAPDPSATTPQPTTHTQQRAQD